MVTMRANSPSSPNARRIVAGLIGLVVGLVVIVVGLNVLSTSDAPPPDTPRVQTGTLPPGSALGNPSGSVPGTAIEGPGHPTSPS